MSAKRVKQLSAASPLRPAAERILRSRLRSVCRLLKDVSAGCVRKPEYVHQLRVSIRRAEAAISAFEPCLKSETTETARRRLKTVRKAAGAARDCDVHASLSHPIGQSGEPEQQMLGRYLAQRLRSDRLLAGEKLIAVAGRRQLRKLKKARRKLLDSARTPDATGYAEVSPTLKVAAIRTLSRACESSRAAGAADLANLGNLHALRVSAKQVRYAVEVFRACLSPDVCDSALAHLREFQAVLGRVNDARQVAAWLAQEARSLATRTRARDIPKGATSELIQEELRVMLGRFETELGSAHAVALPLVPGALDAALKPLEDWIAAAASPAVNHEAVNDRAPAGRTAEGGPDRHEHKQPRRAVKAPNA